LARYDFRKEWEHDERSNMRNIRHSAHRPSSESGFVLLAVLFLVALLLISLAVAAPKISRSIQRDKEAELVHRGEQYKRAIKLYYRKFQAYPSSMDQLMNTNQVRFLRKRYTDPMTGKDDWKLVYYGQAHVPVMGLFGQPIAGTGATGPGAVGTPIGSAATGTSAGSGGSGSLFDSSNSGGSSGGVGGSSGGSSFGSSSGGSSFGSSSGSSFGSSSGGSFGGSSGSSFGGSSGSGFGSSSGGSSFGAPSGSAYGSASPTTGAGTTDSGGSGFGSTTAAGTSATAGSGSAFGASGSTGSTLGGGPIVGVVIPDTKASIKEYKKQKHYNEWEFVYNPLEEQLAGGGMLGATQQPLNGANSGGFNGVGGTGLNGGQTGSQFGSQTGTQMNGTVPTPTPTSPQL
jgi:type II secretory pathway pseudopilin PulG